MFIRVGNAFHWGRGPRQAAQATNATASAPSDPRPSSTSGHYAQQGHEGTVESFKLEAQKWLPDFKWMRKQRHQVNRKDSA